MELLHPGQSRAIKDAIVFLFFLFLLTSLVCKEPRLGTSGWEEIEMEVWLLQYRRKWNCNVCECQIVWAICNLGTGLQAVGYVLDIWPTHLSPGRKSDFHPGKSRMEWVYTFGLPSPSPPFVVSDFASTLAWKVNLPLLAFLKTQFHFFNDIKCLLFLMLVCFCFYNGSIQQREWYVFSHHDLKALQCLSIWSAQMHSSVALRKYLSHQVFGDWNAPL